jgi:peptidoglycan hydrolase-like protein with peptidoglycan-binding domain
MKTWLLLLVAIATFGITAGAAPQKKAAAPAKKSVTTSASAKKKAAPVSARQRYAAASSRYKTKRVVARGRGRSPQPVPVARRSYGQARPTEDRYTEIQRALALRGYLQAEPTGTWSPESADALKRFQKDQKLPPNGKITSLSLIALGLGPKRDAKSVAIAVPNP